MRALRTRSFLSASRVAIISLPVFLLFSLHTPAQAGHSEQAPAASAIPDSSVSSPLSTTVDEVSLDLTVRTKHNKPVRDLLPSELAVTDDGSPVQLSSLRLVAGDSGSEHLVAFVFDRLDTRTAKAAHAIAEKILGVIPEKGYSFAVLQVDRRLRLLQPYTRDRRLVDAAIGDATPPSPVPPLADLTRAEKTLIASLQSDALTVSSADRADGKLVLSALEQSQRIIEDHRSSPSLAALQALVLSDRLLTGRKFIFYFSEGVASNSDSHDIIHSIVGLANRAGVTICVVDADRLDAQMGSNLQAAVASSIVGKGPTNTNISAFGTGSIGNSPSSSGFAPGASLNSVAAHYTAGFEFGDVDVVQSPLSGLTSGTGGIYIHAPGGSKHQLQQLHDDLTTWYQASWVPPIKNYDGQFRPIDIRPLRKDLVIRARSGYFAVRPTESSEVRPFEMPLLNILAGAALPTDIAFHAGILHLGALPDGNSIALAVQVPISQLEIHEDANTHISSVHATIVALIKDSKGAVLQRFSDDFPLHEAPDMFRADSGQVITLQRHFAADPGVYTLETAVMDRIANKAGARRTTFTVEPSPQGPALSDIALVESVEPTQEDNQILEPMRFRDSRVVPNLATELPQNTRSLSLFFLLHPVAGSQIQPVLRMQIFRNGQLLTEMPMELQKVSGTGAAIPYLGTIQGRVFAAGEYQVNALLSQDGRTSSSSVSFGVEGIVAASNSPNPSLTAVGSSSSDGTDSRLVAEASAVNGQFVISSPANPVPSPTDAEIQAMIESARQRALAWTDSLENFYCYEVTNHSVDATGHGDWRHKDTLVELMRYVDHGESRTTLMLNGEKSSIQPDQLQFAHSAGEFGAIFHIVFDPSAKAEFTWKQSAFLDGEPVQVFAFKVALANSGFDLSDRNNRTLHAGFHGLLYLDPATRSVRRISIDVDDIPHTLQIRASSISIDYSWISMQDHDFLLPVRGAVGVKEAGRRPVLNEFEFRNYRRFGSQIRVLTSDELKDLSKN
jgi:VWFA-related protein